MSLVEEMKHKKFAFGIFKGSTYEVAARDQIYVHGLLKVKKLAKFEQEFIDWYQKSNFQTADVATPTAKLRTRMPEKQDGKSALVCVGAWGDSS